VLETLALTSEGLDGDSRAGPARIVGRSLPLAGSLC
jgi:hypothetical protein